MKATIGEAIGINCGTDEIDLLQRQIDALNKRMITIATESLENNTSFEDNEAEYKEISEQIAQLGRRITAIKEKFTRECGLEGVHAHTLRHTFATRAVEVGFEIKSLSEILGHANTTITLNRYVHSSNLFCSFF